jgi:hypothetical protein
MIQYDSFKAVASSILAWPSLLTLVGKKSAWDQQRKSSCINVWIRMSLFDYGKIGIHKFFRVPFKYILVTLENILQGLFYSTSYFLSIKVGNKLW